MYSFSVPLSGMESLCFVAFFKPGLGVKPHTEILISKIKLKGGVERLIGFGKIRAVKTVRAAFNLKRKEKKA